MAKKYRVVIVYSDGERCEQDDLFDTMSEAEEYGLYCCGCVHTGAEILNMSNPGDYPLELVDDEDVDFEVVEVDD